MFFIFKRSLTLFPTSGYYKRLFSTGMEEMFFCGLEAGERFGQTKEFDIHYYEWGQLAGLRVLNSFIQHLHQ